MKQDLELIRMSDIQPEEVQWLWYPCIPLGKLTVIQGDPGEGKTTFVLAVIAALTKGEALPEREPLDPVNILYQTAEDGLADTIRPRLDALGADCSRVLVIDESKRELSLGDERIRQAMEETGAKLLVLDPLQAYLGAEVDMMMHLFATAMEIDPELLEKLRALCVREIKKTNGSISLQELPSGEILSLFSDTELWEYPGQLVRKREMVIGGKVFHITSVFSGEDTSSTTPTGKLLSHIDRQLQKDPGGV